MPNNTDTDFIWFKLITPNASQVCNRHWKKVDSKDKTVKASRQKKKVSVAAPWQVAVVWQHHRQHWTWLALLLEPVPSCQEPPRYTHSLHPSLQPNNNNNKHQSSRHFQLQGKVNYTDIAVLSLTCHSTMGTHTPYRITQCYQPPDRGDIPALTPAEAGTRLSNPGKIQGSADLVGLLHTEMVFLPEEWSPIPVLTGPDGGTLIMRRTPLTTTPHCSSKLRSVSKLHLWWWLVHEQTAFLINTKNDLVEPWVTTFPLNTKNDLVEQWVTTFPLKL